MAWWLVGWLAWAAEPVLPAVQEAPPPVHPVPADPADPSVGGAPVVRLAVTVDAEGGVADVQVSASAGAAFDDAAAQAVRDWIFSPARDADGVAVPATVEIEVVFDPARPAPVSVSGLVLEAGVQAPFADVPLRLIGPSAAGGATTRTARTDASGRFAVAGLRPGVWRLEVGSSALRADPVSFTVREGAPVDIRLYAAPSRAWLGADEVIEVVGRLQPPEVTERTLSAADVRVLPGSNGDVVKAVQNLPGVARAPLGIGQLIIRGTAPEDSRYTLDGMELPIVFHFAGLATVLNADLLDDVVFLPGNFGVRYGRNLGGRVDLRTSQTLPTQSSGYVSLDLFQAAALGTFRVSERTAVTAAIRRSYIDAVLTPVLSDDERAFRAPRYLDAELRVLHRLPRGTIDALAVISDDRFVTGEPDDDGEISPSLGLGTSFQKARVQWRAPLSEGWRSELSVLLGPDAQTFKLRGEDAAFERRVSFDVREELIWERGQDALRVGLDVQSGSQAFRYDVGSFGPLEEGKAWFFAPALYIEPTWRRGPVQVTPGVRADLLTWRGVWTGWSVDPRLAVQVDAGPTTTLTAAVGRYAQFPTARQVLPEGDGTAGLAPAWSLQSGLGLRQRLPAGFSVELNGYYNRLFDLVVGRDERFRFFTGPPPSGPFDTFPYANAGGGMICGVEVLARWASEWGSAWISGTFGRSFRTPRDSTERAAFTYDQPFVLTALGTWQLPRRWRIGARVRTSAGNPYTPVVQRIYDLDQRGYIPVYGPPQSGRLPPFFSLDLRIDKAWVYRTWTFTFYLDLQNVTNTRALEVIGWTWDYGDEDGVFGLPIIPAFGLRADLYGKRRW